MVARLWWLIRLGSGSIANAVLTSQTFTHTLNYTADITKNLNLMPPLVLNIGNLIIQIIHFPPQDSIPILTQSTIIDIPYTAMMQDASIQNLPSTYIDPTTELQSYFARAILNYSSKYYLTATFRADGSSKFGKNNRYGYFPSIAGKWQISNENFMKNSTLFSNLAIRASWGKTGNQEFPAGASQEQFGFSSFNTAGQINVANPDLKWETTTSYDFGLDFGLFKGRVYGAF